jgi:heme-degrading monooxygenase HmoA
MTQPACAYARVTSTVTPRDQQAAALDAFRTTTVPIVLTRPGLLELLVLASRASERVLTISLWESEEARHATSSDPAVLSNLAAYGHLVRGAFTRAAYDVFLDTWQRTPALVEPDTPYARVTTAQFRQGAREGGLTLLREITSRPSGEPPDYAGSLVLVDPVTDGICVIEAWRSRAALADYDASVYQHDRMARERQILLTSPAHEVFRIILIATPARP